MRSLFTTLLLLMFIAFNIQAQESNLIVFTEDGAHFYLLINGEYQNQTPATNVKVLGLKEAAYQIKLVYSSNHHPPLTKKIYPQAGEEYTFIAKKDRKDRLKLRVFGVAAIGNSGTNPNQLVINYGSPQVADPQPTPPNTTVVETEVPTTPTEPSVENPGQPVPSTQVTITTQETTVTNPSNPSEIKFGMQVNPNGVEVTITDPTLQGTSTTTTTTTTTTTISGTTTTTTVDGTNIDHHHHSETIHTEPALHSNDDFSNNNMPCQTKDGIDFKNFLQTLKAEDFPEDRLAKAKQLSGDCMTVQQVREIMQTIDFEDDRLDFAKFAYTRTIDPNNYSRVFDLFDFQESTKALTAYMQQH